MYLMLLEDMYGFMPKFFLYQIILLRHHIEDIMLFKKTIYKTNYNQEPFLSVGYINEERTKRQYS